MNYSVLVEFKLKSKRRVDVIGLSIAGKFVIVEIQENFKFNFTAVFWIDHYFLHCCQI